MQSGFRGFLLTEDTDFLSSYYAGLTTVPINLRQLKEMAKYNDSQRALLDTIVALHAQWINYADTLIESKKMADEGRPGAYNLLFEDKFRKQVGKKLNDKITQSFLEFDRGEYKIRNMHGAALISSIKRTHTFSFIVILLTVTIGLAGTVFIVSLITKRIKTMVKLAEDISLGHFNVVEDTRNDELTGLSTSLNIMSDKLSKNILELENRNRELDKFAYVVSHDLKAPVRGIHNVIKWIEEDLGPELSPEMKKYLAIIPQRTRRMEDLINGLLDYARISQKTTASRVDVGELVREVVDTIVPRQFKVHIEKLPTLYTEPIKLHQVFANLISNAVRYTPHANGHITVTCAEFADFCRFSVRDNGIGIDPEYHSKIFEIFQTLREKNEAESTGVGLAIVKKIVEEQGGTISVHSFLGTGSEFIFTWKNKKANG